MLSGRYRVKFHDDGVEADVSLGRKQIKKVQY